MHMYTKGFVLKMTCEMFPFCYTSSQMVGSGMYTSHASGMLSHETATAQMRRPHASATAMMTSEALAHTMAVHFPDLKVLIIIDNNL